MYGYRKRRAGVVYYFKAFFHVFRLKPGFWKPVIKTRSGCPCHNDAHAGFLKQIFKLEGNLQIQLPFAHSRSDADSSPVNAAVPRIHHYNKLGPRGERHSRRGNAENKRQKERKREYQG